MDWVYKQIIGFLANFFAEMGNMGAEMFEMSWVQSIVLFFSYLAWILYAVGFVVACAECGLEYSSGRADIKGTAMRCRGGRHESHQGIHGGQSFYGCTDQAL